MAHLKVCPILVSSKRFCSDSLPTLSNSSLGRRDGRIHLNLRDKDKTGGNGIWVSIPDMVNHGKRKLLKRKRLLTCSTSSGEVGLIGKGEDGKFGVPKQHFGNLVSEFGWRVRKLVARDDELRMASQVQAEAFHVQMPILNDSFFALFKADVLAGLLYKLRNSPPNRYACLVAEPVDASYSQQMTARSLVGVVDVTVLRDDVVLKHLDGVEEYLYVSGIAVLRDFRRQKVATVLLKACDILSLLWGFDYLALRAYEDDSAACKLYSNAGYKVVSGDPRWMTTWIRRKRRILMIKQSSLREWC